MKRLRPVLAMLGFLAGGVAVAAPRLPATLPALSDAELAARKATFRQRNPQRWRAVDVDARGFVRHVRTDAPVEADALLRANADLFGIDAADVDRLRGPRHHRRFVEAIGDAVLVAIDVRASGRITDIAVSFRVAATPIVTEDALRARLIGQTYDETTTWLGSAPLDCGMTPLGGAGCQRRVTVKQRRVTLADRDPRVRTSLMVTPDRTVHLVRCVDAGHRPFRWIYNTPGHTRSYVPVAGAPGLPLVVDAVTGTALATSARDCRDPVLSNLR